MHVCEVCQRNVIADGFVCEECNESMHPSYDTDDTTLFITLEDYEDHGIVECLACGKEFDYDVPIGHNLVEIDVEGKICLVLQCPQCNRRESGERYASHNPKRNGGVCCCANCLRETQDDVPF